MLNNPLATRAHLYTLAGVCALPRALSPHREISPRSDMAALPQGQYTDHTGGRDLL